MDLIFVLVLLAAASGVGARRDPRRRLLQTASAAPLPTCELGLEWNVFDVEPSAATGRLTVVNNREVDAPAWQAVFRFRDAARVGLAAAAGAQVAAAGTAAGVPARLVSAPGAPPLRARGGRASAELVAAPLAAPSAAGDESLLLEGMGVNGLACRQVAPEPGARAPLAWERCAAELQFFADFGGGATRAWPGGAPPSCRAAYCCGYAVAGPGAAAAPEAPPPAVDAPAVPEAPLPAIAIAPEPEPPVTASNGPPAGDDGAPSTGTGGVDGALPPLPPGPDAPGGGGGKNGVLALVGAAAAAAAVVAAVAVAALWVARRWRRRHRALAADDEKPGGGGAAAVSVAPTATPSPPPPGGTLTLRHAASSFLDGFASVGAADGGAPAAAPPTGAGSVLLVAAPGAPPDEVVLHEKLGQGAFGAVHRGTWRGQRVAVKILAAAAAPGARELASFRREIGVLQQFCHPNIVSFLAAGAAPPHICIVQELVEGGSLAERLHGKPGARVRAPLLYAELLAVADDVAAAMAYLHPRLVHRDLKAANVLIDASGRAKVCDFGIARQKERTFLSTANGQAGTPAYMAPELFDNAQVTEKVDVYSFGILLWECFTGLVPWAAVPSPMQIIYQVGVLGERPPIPRGAPPAFVALCVACWAERPEARPGFGEIRVVLAAERARVGTEAEAGTLPPPLGGGTGGGDTGGSSGSSAGAARALHEYASTAASTESPGGAGGVGGGGTPAPAPPPPPQQQLQVR